MPAFRPIAASLTLLTAFIAPAAHAAAPAETAEGVAFFESRVRPVLVERCYDCHSTGKKTKGGLALDTRDATRRGGDSGPVLVVGEPEKSKLIEAIRYKNRDLQMPPKGALTAAQVRDLETWVKMGAPDPREAKLPATVVQQGIDVEKGRSFWSFGPITNPQPPTVSNSEWVRTPVDAFVLKRLEDSELRPAPPADRRTLLRRATFDLTGLPPTPAEVDAFLADTSPDAFAKVIDRLLASPAYGERWGRHWLDVARYADSNGLDENIAFGHAWRYRDYVVRAFNSDKPYDQFLIEQLAGDLLPAATEAQRIEQLTATGFLALGARVLAEPDVRKLEMDIIDEQIDTTGKAFLGMTLGCCRCHDHKFDPISTADYYGLAAIFRSTTSLSTEKMGAIKFWYEHSLATPEQTAASKQHEALVKAQTAKVAAHLKEARAKLRAELHAGAADYLAAAAELSEAADFPQIARLAEQRGLRARYLLTCRQYLARNPNHPVFARWRELAAADQHEAVRSHYAKLFHAAATALREAKAKNPKATAPTADPVLTAAHEAISDVAGFLAIPDIDADALDADTLAAQEQMQAELRALESKAPDLPAIMGVKDGPVVKSLPIHVRGSYLTLGKPVERGFPEVMRRSSSFPPILPAGQSGRLQLARWMASGEHPLTARVMVNRLWRWHFGAGIVRTTDNFGALGDRPTHPELLDWLARRFVEDGWSVKQMHRLIMTSSTYQMASANPAAGRVSAAPDPALLDPENRLLWRANVRRLEAEEIRDAVLAVSGSLSGEMGGKTVPLRNREFVFNHTSRDRTTYETSRRSIYIPIIRNHLYDVLEQFDYPDPTMPTGNRNSTVVPPQALIMLNAPLVMNAAEKLAARLLDNDASDEENVRKAYATLYARPASESETQRAVAFLKAQSNRKSGWTLLCHTLLAANEFIYLR